MGTRQPPPREPRLTAAHIGYSHPGGSKPPGAKNQDTYFVLEIDEYNAVFGVLDGHGSENGTLVAQTASDTIQAHLAEHFNALRTQPDATFAAAFRAAHDAARQALLRLDDSFTLVDGVVIEEWEDEDGSMRQDTIDGGTTVTVEFGTKLLLRIRPKYASTIHSHGSEW